jgi:ADP-ribose pyrophosphatase YjhB (NUDIX family)
MGYKSEKEFLNDYDMNKFERPTGYTSDIVIFTLVKTNEYDEEAKAFKNDLQLLLVKRLDYPQKGKWALPGGFVEIGENALDGAVRELEEETGISDVYVKHFGVYDDYERDMRGNKWIITNAHYAIVNEKYLEKRKAGSDAEEVRLFSYKEVFELDLAFDHEKIIKDAYEIIKKEMLETTLAKEFLNKEFFLSDLFMVLNSLEEMEIKKSNFFTKASKLPFIEVVVDENGKLKKEISHSKAKRPSAMYRFKDLKVRASIY